MSDETEEREKPKRGVHRYTIKAQLDSAGGKKKGFLYVDRKTGRLAARAEGGKLYEAQFTLNEVADFIVKNALYEDQAVAKRFSPKRARRAR